MSLSLLFPLTRSHYVLRLHLGPPLRPARSLCFLLGRFCCCCFFFCCCFFLFLFHDRHDLPSFFCRCGASRLDLPSFWPRPSNGSNGSNGFVECDEFDYDGFNEFDECDYDGSNGSNGFLDALRPLGPLGSPQRIEQLRLRPLGGLPSARRSLRAQPLRLLPL